MVSVEAEVARSGLSAGGGGRRRPCAAAVALRRGGGGLARLGRTSGGRGSSLKGRFGERRGAGGGSAAA